MGLSFVIDHRARCTHHRSTVSFTHSGCALIEVRLSIAANFLKACLLGDLNVPGRSQTRTVLDELYRLGISEKGAFSTRTWERWLSRQACVDTPQIGKIGVMDEAHALLSMPAWSHPQGFHELVRGGLVSSLLAPTRAKNVWPIMIERAKLYLPVSSLHLHLDALDVLSLTGDCSGVPAANVRQLAAARILELLHGSWSPRGGKVFNDFRSDWRLRWDAADPDERVKMEKRCEAIQPNPMQKWMVAGAWPDWSKVAVPVDVGSEHVHKLLFCLPADANFLVSERLKRWALDSVTALLALFSHAWADRYEKFAVSFSPEMAYFIALEAVFLREDPVEELRGALLPAMEWSDARWTAESWAKFTEGREAYANFLSLIGLSVAEVVDRLTHLRDVEPLVFRG